jgi:hypothetical protein
VIVHGLGLGQQRNIENIYNDPLSMEGHRRRTGPPKGPETGENTVAGNNSRPNFTPIALIIRDPIDQEQT